MQEESNKGGRIAKVNAEYFPLPGNRTDEIKALKLEKGSLGIDIYITLMEKLTVSAYFTFHYAKAYKLKVFSLENGFNSDEFKDVLEYMVKELQLFDKVLYSKGYLFSRQFVEQFDAAGLFAKRKIKAVDIFEYVDNLAKGPIDLTPDDALPF